MKKEVDVLIEDYQSAPGEVKRTKEWAKQLKVLLTQLKEKYEEGDRKDERCKGDVDYYEIWHAIGEKTRRSVRGRLMKDMSPLRCIRATGESQAQQELTARKPTSESGAKQDKEQRESSLQSSNTSAGRVTDIQAPASLVQRESSQQSLNASVERVTDSQAPAFLTSASADESSVQDTVNTQKTRAKDAPLGDTSLLVVSNILIPVSTIEIFFQRFDMLQDQLDGLSALVSRGSVPRGISSALAEGGATVGTEELNTRISALETQLADNISASNRLLDANKLLLDENSILRDELQQTQQLLGRLHRARRDHDTDSMPVSVSGPMVASSPSIIIDSEAAEVVGARKCSSPRLAPTGGGAGSEMGGAEGCEVIINGSLQDDFDEKISDVVAFALPGAVLPALKKSDIAGTRVLRMRRPVRAQRNDMTTTKSATSRGTLREP
ncbi:hypothetical protein TSAR_005057 [Trichomalopsis sarcophagae]|uniref:Uncharacterized protein n=1 Tax=Trichomalopsis sarcophagae TaxID=543379 RepID=A0A232EY43_9HYME|nr:hypothetical protein TSAR_005057 [Trichomalopsis sarcophagae]